MKKIVKLSISLFPDIRFQVHDYSIPNYTKLILYQTNSIPNFYLYLYTFHSAPLKNNIINITSILYNNSSAIFDVRDIINGGCLPFFRWLYWLHSWILLCRGGSHRAYRSMLCRLYLCARCLISNTQWLHYWASLWSRTILPQWIFRWYVQDCSTWK